MVSRFPFSFCSIVTLQESKCRYVHTCNMFKGVQFMWCFNAKWKESHGSGRCWSERRVCLLRQSVPSLNLHEQGCHIWVQFSLMFCSHYCFSWNPQLPLSDLQYVFGTAFVLSVIPWVVLMSIMRFEMHRALFADMISWMPAADTFLL